MENDNYKVVRIIQACFFLLIPFILWGVAQQRLDSISAYVNFTPVTFTLLLSLASMLFVYDGIVERIRGYNIVIGLGLLGVIIFNHLEYPIIHYVFAGIFFLGSLFNMVFFSSNHERGFKILAALLVLFGMAGTFIFEWYSIFWAEWIGMIPISIHYILETLNKID